MKQQWLAIADRTGLAVLGRRLARTWAWSRRGQALVHAAIILVVLLIFVGLAIDAGLAYTLRRQMQNAADAGSLAGARELCLMDNRGSAASIANDYAQQNGAETATIELRNDDGNVDAANGQVVWVEAETTSATTLLGLAGIDSIAVRASAAASCQKTGSACGFWPIAFPLTVWEDLACGEHLYIWDDDKVDYNCDTWGCDVQGDGDGDAVIHPGERGWLDLRGQFEADDPGTCGAAGGASLVKALIEDNCAGKITLPKCLPGEPGTKASAEGPVENRVGDNVLIPLFDYIGCNGDDYHIVDVGCVTVVGYHSKITMWTWDAGNHEWESHKNEKAIEVIKTCDNCTTRCGSSTGQTPGGDGGNVIVVGLSN